MSDSKAKQSKESAERIEKIGYYTLIIQNLLIIIPIYGLLVAAFIPIEIIGFLLIAIGFLLRSRRISKYRNNFLLGGMYLIGWIICRISYQFIIPTKLLSLDGGYELIGHTLPIISNL